MAGARVSRTVRTGLLQTDSSPTPGISEATGCACESREERQRGPSSGRSRGPTGRNSQQASSPQESRFWDSGRQEAWTSPVSPPLASLDPTLPSCPVTCEHRILTLTRLRAQERTPLNPGFLIGPQSTGKDILTPACPQLCTPHSQAGSPRKEPLLS